MHIEGVQYNSNGRFPVPNQHFPHAEEALTQKPVPQRNATWELLVPFSSGSSSFSQLRQLARAQ